ncbi:hypothetical protein FQK02_09660 [Xanthomonas vasicola]|uniref:Uncharacterized protein n=1 Tax=Xanthomonas vasicola pv. vasculorum NCPPB 890 TaxID=1184265 RepID=A0A836ZSL9_XANVA|nr:hypothetical protein [Xanthomonas vasicola]KFA27289.1 hypothetical protein KW5_0112595 [Xanthomonas vasicola pv. vasculorum NCPPB 1326]KFA31805.1 hypothetical protein KWG_0109390 [Xanthomonas vasicola pv. vasculorum NCPPB 1381]MBV6747943.1 hypothetical protein [Xanthomonas vasicola pv. vasculorum NCPPB 890]MBV6893534.1 hypothetical protein [Xanthomonas vasicola pv. vasculorum]MDO6949615.1 hypothetical protein [Xanthomonas vasicola]
MSDPSYVLSTFYIDPGIDDWLKHQASSLKKTKNDVLRKYLEIGIAYEAAGKQAQHKYSQVVRRINDEDARQVLKGSSSSVTVEARNSPARVVVKSGGSVTITGGESKRTPASPRASVGKFAKKRPVRTGGQVTKVAQKKSVKKAAK